MFSNSSPYRWLLTALLALSVSFAGVVPASRAMAASAAAGSASGQAAMPCCCGGDDDRCCGMACCVPHAPATPQAPAPAPQSEEHQPSCFGLVAVDGRVLCAAGKCPPRAQCLLAAYDLHSEVSLQLLRIRLDV